MQLSDPVDAYHAATNLDAHMMCNFLLEAGIDATVVEDLPPQVLGVLSIISPLYTPRIRVNRDDAPRARAMLEEFERQKSERAQPAAPGQPITVTCEGCGQTATFPAEQQGTVQDCPHCHAYVDVEVPGASEEWNVTSDDSGDSEGDDSEPDNSEL